VFYVVAEEIIYTSRQERQVLRAPLERLVVREADVDTKGKRFRKEIKAQDLLNELTNEAPKENRGEPLIPLSNARIVGEFDLKHHTIEKPVVIRNCEFEENVDLRYCEFEQVVDFTGCTFHKEFNSGDEIESHTLYKKDLICNGTGFKGTGKFSGVRVEGSAHFSDADFLNRELSADFRLAYFEKALYFDNALFFGQASFASLKCGPPMLNAPSAYCHGSLLHYLEVDVLRKQERSGDDREVVYAFGRPARVRREAKTRTTRCCTVAAHRPRVALISVSCPPSFTCK
jgi:hypothetical protein